MALNNPRDLTIADRMIAALSILIFISAIFSPCSLSSLFRKKCYHTIMLGIGGVRGCFFSIPIRVVLLI
jgi:hypothetical protein